MDLNSELFDDVEIIIHIVNYTIFIQSSYDYLEPTLVFTQISPESVIADTGRGVIVGLAPPLDTPHGGTRVLIYKMNPPKTIKIYSHGIKRS